MLNFIKKFYQKKQIRKIKEKNLTYLTDKKLASIAETCTEIESRKIPGIFIEAGCALGGSSILIGSVKNQERILNIYDVFGMIPPPSDNDTEDVHERFEVISQGRSAGIGNNKYYGYENDLLNIVKNNFREFDINPEKNNISFIKGLLQDTMHFNQPIAFAHIDVDWYDPVKTSFERIFPNLVVGGCIIFDDYYHWQSCKKAVDECLLLYKGKYKQVNAVDSMKIIKTDY